jgi:transposase
MGGHVRRNTQVADLREQWLEREERIKAYDRDVERLAKELPVCKELQTVPGIGPIIATLLHAYAGDATHYASGRHFAASLGLVPRQHATGGRERLLGISKQGNKHLRRQLVHGARAAYRQLAGRTDSRLARWIAGLGDKHVNKIVVALANKLARIAWVIMARGVSYQP